MIDDITKSLAQAWCDRFKLCKGCRVKCVAPTTYNTDIFFEWAEKKMKYISKLELSKREKESIK